MSNDFTIGRSDFSVTVYVPWNCTNNCKFCSSKKDYEKIKSDFSKLKESLQFYLLLYLQEENLALILIN